MQKSKMAPKLFVPMVYKPCLTNCLKKWGFVYSEYNGLSHLLWGYLWTLEFIKREIILSGHDLTVSVLKREWSIRDVLLLAVSFHVVRGGGYMARNGRGPLEAESSSWSTASKITETASIQPQEMNSANSQWTWKRTQSSRWGSSAQNVTPWFLWDPEQKT